MYDNRRSTTPPSPNPNYTSRNAPPPLTIHDKKQQKLPKSVPGPDTVSPILVKGNETKLVKRNVPEPITEKEGKEMSCPQRQQHHANPICPLPTS
jgi:hypothetical protein